MGRQYDAPGAYDQAGVLYDCGAAIVPPAGRPHRRPPATRPPDDDDEDVAVLMAAALRHRFRL